MRMEGITIHAFRFGVLAIWLLILSCYYETKPNPSTRDRVCSILCGIGSIGFLLMLVFAV